MPVLEVIGAISASASLLEQVIKATNKICEANERRRELGDFLEKHLGDLESVLSVIYQIGKEKDLQTSSVLKEVNKITDLSKRLLQQLESLSRGSKKKSTFGQIAFQVRKGEKEEKALVKTIKELHATKQDLSIQINIRHVELTSTVLDAMNTTPPLSRPPAPVVPVIGNTQNTIAISVAAPPTPPYSPSHREYMNPSPLAEKEKTPIVTETPVSQQDIEDNEATEDANQVNGYIGETTARLAIKRNKASGKATQINGGMNAASFELLMKSWGK